MKLIAGHGTCRHVFLYQEVNVPLVSYTKHTCQNDRLNSPVLVSPVIRPMYLMQGLLLL
jgi:hypothetical protein